MRDIFPSPTILANLIRPIARTLSLSTLPLHIHEILFAWGFYHFAETTISPTISTWLLPSVYPKLSARATINWNIHVTSLIQSTFITVLALVVIVGDDDRRRMDWIGRIWGYTGAGGAVQGFAAGYFLWDLIVSIIHFDVSGVGSLAHAVSALLVTSVGFRPFANFYGLNFILYEISTPFLNIHWFCDKLDMTGSRLQLYNGILLLITFFCGRVLWGNYQSYHIYSDVWKAVHTRSIGSLIDPSDPVYTHLENSLGMETKVMDLPLWLVFVYLGSNTMLNFLNIYWFSKMVQALIKRFRPSSGPKVRASTGDIKTEHVT